MDVTPLIPEGRKLITAYGDGRFLINGEPVASSIIITPWLVMTWDVTSPEGITAESLEQVLALGEGDTRPEILLIGTGNVQFFLPQPFRNRFRQQGIAIDAMLTGAACRTYNVLLSEERRVAAALIAV